MHVNSILTVTIVGLLAVMSPGPDFLIVTRNSLIHSKRVGLCTALGITFGTLCWVAASLAGISYIISKTVVLFSVIKWLGAAYLVYIGVQSFRAKTTSAPIQSGAREEAPCTMSPGTAFKIGLLTNLLNPKAALFFVSFFSVIIGPETPMFWRCAYGLELSLIALSWFSLLATVLSVQIVKGIFERFSKWIERVTGAILILLGIKLALYRD